MLSKKNAEATGNSKIESRHALLWGPLLGSLHLALLGFLSKLLLEIKCCARVRGSLKSAIIAEDGSAY
jgi:hypothetical protein